MPKFTETIEPSQKALAYLRGNRRMVEGGLDGIARRSPTGLIEVVEPVFYLDQEAISHAALYWGPQGDGGQRTAEVTGLRLKVLSARGIQRRIQGLPCQVVLTCDVEPAPAQAAA